MLYEYTIPTIQNQKPLYFELALYCEFSTGIFFRSKARKAPIALVLMTQKHQFLRTLHLDRAHVPWCHGTNLQLHEVR